MSEDPEDSWPSIHNAGALIGKKITCAGCGWSGNVEQLVGRDIDHADRVLFVCFKCATVQVFEPSGDIRKITEEELSVIPPLERSTLEAYKAHCIRRIRRKSNLN